MSIDNAKNPAGNNEAGQPNAAEQLAKGAEKLADTAAEKVHGAAEKMGDAAAEALKNASPETLSDLAKQLAAKQAAKAKRIDTVKSVGKKVGIGASLVGLGVLIGHFGSQHLSRRVIVATAPNENAGEAPAA